MSLARFKLVFFTPKENTGKILEHFFSKYPQDLGRIGNYEQCAFVTRGTGQFKSVGSANPTIGNVGQLEYVKEDKVEVVVNDRGQHNEIRNVIKELKNVHPYEEVAYDVYKLEDF